VTIVILLILVVVLWIAVLAPSAWRRRSERRGDGSINHFHHQLELLEHAGPRTIPPAYRLHTALPGAPMAAPSFLDEDSSRPKLVLLRPTDDEDAADIDGGDGCHYERVGVLEVPETPSVAIGARSGLAAHRREQAQLRCTILLRSLVGVALVTAAIGVVPSLRLAWVFTGLTGLASLGLMGLIGYAREVEAERKSRRAAASLRRQWQEEVDLDASAPLIFVDWDDDDLPEQVAAAR
jgi:hypothetical protein